MSDCPVDQTFIRESWEDHDHIRDYVDAVADVGLWESERRMIAKYIPQQAPILDIGCGAGRTTFGLYEAGYRNITGCDLSASMIDAARRIARERDLPTPFDIVDATSMPYENERFEGALFSGQGLMCIPGHERRLNALREVRRVLRPGGHFIFTTHDRDSLAFADFRREERARWDRGEHDSRLAQFGDRLLIDSRRLTYLHFPSRAEVRRLIADAGMIPVEDRLRSEVAVDSEAARKFNSDCRMWVVRRPEEDDLVAN